MNLSYDSVHKSALHPEWSSLHAHTLPSSSNIWPIREQSHSRRFYTTAKVRKSQASESQLRFEVTPITTKMEMDQFKKQKSHSSMAFCSTSKVTYMPLPGFSHDSLSQLKWNDSHSNFFPSICRPISRPVILHGKRYTVLAVEGDISHSGISLNNKEEDKFSQKTERSSEQRRRFNEIERHKSSTRMYKDNVETTQYRIRRDYCLSGHRMKIMASIESVDERLNRLKPILNIQSIKKKEEINTRRDMEVNDVQEGEYCAGSTSRKCEGIQTPTISTKDCFISVEIVSEIKEEIEISTKSSSLTEGIKRAFEDAKNADIDRDSFDKAKLCLEELIKNYLEEIQQIEEDGKDYLGNDMDNVWSVLQPKEKNMDEKEEEVKRFFEEKFGKDPLLEVDCSSFLTTIFDRDDQQKQKMLWSKTFSLAKVNSLNTALYLKISFLIQMFREEDQSLEVTHAKVHFWMKLFAILFCIKEDSNLDFESYLNTLVKIIVFKKVLDENSEASLKKKVESFVNHKLRKGSKEVETNSLSLIHLLETMLWLLSSHSNISFPSSLDDMAFIVSTKTIPDH